MTCRGEIISQTDGKCLGLVNLPRGQKSLTTSLFKFGLPGREYRFKTKKNKVFLAPVKKYQNNNIKKHFL